MAGKKILATIFAAAILVKLLFLAINPAKWLGLTDVALGHPGLMMAIYLVLLVVAGCYIFIGLNLLDVAVVMLFTSLLIGVTLLPYAASLLKMRDEIAAVGLARIWPAAIIWAAIALAVLSRVFGRKRRGKD